MVILGLGYLFGFGDGVKKGRKERKEASEWNEKIKREKDYKKETKNESDLEVK